MISLFVELVLVIALIFIINKVKEFKYLYISILIAILWVVSIIFTDINSVLPYNEILSIVSSRFSFIFGIWVMYFAFIFTLRIEEGYLYKVRHSFVSNILIMINIVFSIVSTSRFVVTRTDFIANDNSIVSTFGSFYKYTALLIVVYMLLIIIATIIQLIKSDNKIIKVRFLYFLVGIILSSVWAVITNLFMPLLGIKEIRVLGPIGMLFFIGFAGYAVSRNRFVNVKLIRYRLFFISVFSAFLFVSFYVINYFHHVVWGSIYKKEAYLSGVLLSILITALIEALINYLQNNIKNSVTNASRPYEYRERILKEISTELSLKKLVSKFVEMFKTVYEMSLCSIYLRVDQNTLFDHSNIDSTDLVSDFINLNKKNKLLIRTELDMAHHKENKKVVNWLKDNHIEIVARLSLNIDDSICFLLIGEKKDESIYTIDEIQFIESSIQYFESSISRAILYSNVKNFNRILESKIKIATAKIQTAYDELKQLDDAKSNFLSMASHQLRTPLSVARGYVSILAEGDFGGLTEDQKKYVIKTEENLIRLNKIVNEILDASQIEGNRFTVNLEPHDIVKIVTISYEQAKNAAEAKGLKYTLSVPTNAEIVINVDEIKMVETISNLIDNAINYTPKGEVSVKMEQKENSVLISIADTGIGIPKNKHNEIFKRFSRLENAKKIRPDGSGIGLHLAKTVVDLHKGRIWFESEEGKGTTFFVELYKSE